MNRRSVGRVSGMRCCGLCRWGELGPGSGGVEWCYVCVSPDSFVDDRSRYFCILC